MAEIPKDWGVEEKRDFVVLALARLDERLELFSLVCQGASLYSAMTEAEIRRLKREAEESLPLPEALPAKDPAL
jgi:hypothetical protein